MTMPRWLARLAGKLNPVPLRGAHERDLDDEMRFHIEMEAADLVRAGVPAHDAMRRARAAFGGMDRTREEWRDVRTSRFGRLVRDVPQDIRYAARGLIRRPGFTAIAVLTLAIGIGGTTAIFSAVNALLFRSLPYAAPEQLMTVSLTVPARGGPGGLRARDDEAWSYPKYEVFRGAQTIFSDLALYTPKPFTITSGAVEQIQGEFVGARYLRTLGLAPVLGRDFDPAIDAHAGAERQAIISYSLWQRRYNADPNIVGKTIDIDHSPYIVVGVGPADFRGLTGQGELFVPISTRPSGELDVQNVGDHDFYMVARRRSNVSVPAAIAAVKLLGARVREAFVDQGMYRGWGATARPLDDIRVTPLIRRALLVAFGAVGMVLLIACVNVANLLLGRASTRRREIAVRLALGAARARVVRLLLVESILLAAVGGLAGIAVAWIGVRALSTLDPAMLTPRGNDVLTGLGAVKFSAVHLDAVAMAFGLAITLIVGVVFGLVPALQATGASMGDAMKLASGDGDARQRGARGRRMLVVIEVALAMILLAGSGLLIRSFDKLTAIDPGFEAKNVLTMRLTIPDGALSDKAMPAFYVQLLDRLRALPGVVDASLNSCPPLGGGCMRTFAEFPKRPNANGAKRVPVRESWVTPTWFATVHVPLKKGRLFAETDRRGAPTAVLINETAARTIWPGENPISRELAVNFDKGTVVGIVGDVRQFVDSSSKPEVYLPYAQSPLPEMMIFLRTIGEPVAIAPSARQAIQELVPQYPVYDIQPMSDRAAGAWAQARFSAVILGLFAATAVSLAVVGIYGVMSLLVTARTREIGIRMALGADQRSVRRMVVGEGFGLVAVGVILGLAGAVACTRVLRALLFDVSPTDPATYAGIVVVLGFATVAASWLPARRASGVDPVAALRAD